MKSAVPQLSTQPTYLMVWRTGHHILYVLVSRFQKLSSIVIISFKYGLLYILLTVKTLALSAGVCSSWEVAISNADG